MPVYDYQCEECAEMFQEEHRMDFEGPVQCPTCLTHMTHKIILQCPSQWIYWKDARSSSQATVPKFYRAVTNKRAQRGTETAEDFGGV